MVVDFLGRVAKGKPTTKTSPNALLPSKRAVDPIIDMYMRGQINNAKDAVRGVKLIDPAAIKSTELFSRSAMDFIMDNAVGRDMLYSEQQLLGAAMSSVYLYAALQRIANLISRVKIVAEVKGANGRWARVKETSNINNLFSSNTAQLLSRMYLNYAVYGSTLVYKTKTRRALQYDMAGTPIYDYREGAVAGLYVLDKPNWDLDESGAYGEIIGAHVNRYDAGDSPLRDTSWLDRREFIYFTNWNPENPNRGKSLVSICIHEAVANAAIAQWMSEYFTRGAMPFILVSMDEDPGIMTDADMRKYKRQFEEYWQGISSSLRSVFFDRKVSVEQVGIAAGDVGAPELDESALAGITATIGLDKELIKAPDGGTQDRHEAMIARVFNDTVIPLVNGFLVAINRDLGLPDNMHLVADLSEITELDADRADKADAEINILQSGLQDFNETRSRLKMTPVASFDGWYNSDGKMMPLDKILETAIVPHEEIRSYAMELWDSDLAKKSEVLEIVGRELPKGEIDGYKSDIENAYDKLTGLWGEDLLYRSQVLQMLGYNTPEGVEDGYRSEIERGADYIDRVTGLWGDNLLTRSQTIQLLDMGIELPKHAPDGYSDEIGNRRDATVDLWDSNLMTRGQAMDMLGISIPDEMHDGFQMEIENWADNQSEALQQRKEDLVDFWDRNLITRSSVAKELGLPIPENMIDGYQQNIEKHLDADSDRRDAIVDLWGENLMTRSQVARNLGITLPEDAVDGYQQEVDVIAEALADAKAAELTAPPEGEETDNKESSWRSVTSPVSDDDDEYYSGVPSFNYISPEDADEPAVEAAEEDYLEDYGNYPDDPLQPSFGDNIDYLPPESLPTVDYETDFDTDAWGNEPLYPPKDYYESVASDEQEYPSLDISDYIDEDEYEDSDEEEMKSNVYEADIEVENIFDEVFDSVFGDGIVEQFIDDAIIETDAENNFYISLWIGNNHILNDISRQVHDYLIKNNIIQDENDIEWQNKDTFHITLAFAPDVTNEQADSALNLLPNKAEPITIQTSKLSTFDNPDATVVKLDVLLSDKLVNLQAQIAKAFMAQGLALSPHSNPESFSPHITICYLPAGVEFPTDINTVVDGRIAIRPRMIAIGKDDYDLYGTIHFKTSEDIRNELADQIAGTSPHNISLLPRVVREAIARYSRSDNTVKEDVIKAVKKAAIDGLFDDLNNVPQDVVSRYLTKNNNFKASQDDAISELQAWENATIKSGVKKGMRFEVKHIDAPDETWIKEQLSKADEWQDWKKNAREVFDTVRSKYVTDSDGE